MTDANDRITDAVRARMRWLGGAEAAGSVDFPRERRVGGPMLNKPTHAPGLPTGYEIPPPAREIGFADVLSFLGRRKLAISVGIAAVLGIAILYVATTPSEYSATAVVVVDTSKVQIFDRGDVASQEAMPNASIETELQILRSSRIAYSVVDKLQLTKDAAFMEGLPSAFQTLADLAPGWLNRSASASQEATPPAVSEDALRRRARRILARSLQIQRAGLSYAIAVTVTAADRQQASDIANGFVDAYLADQVTQQTLKAQQLSKWLQDRIAELRAQGFEADRQALEKSAFRATYDQFLLRYTEALQQESLPATRASAVSPAEPPSTPSWPNVPFILAGALVFGSALGLGGALTRELLDRSIWRRNQLEDITQVPCLGVLPTFRVKPFARRRIARESARLRGDRKFLSPPEFMVSRSAPFSQFAEGLRSTRVAAQSAHKPISVMGIVSSVAHEGKTTVAVNLAQLAASSERVLLIDADFRNPTLSRLLATGGAPGLAQLVSGEGNLTDMIWTDASTGMSFLPAGIDSRQAGGSEVLGSERMKILLDWLTKNFDLIVLDLPPVVPVVDVRAMAHLVDAFVFVVEWGATTDEVVVRAFSEGGVEGKVLGALLNKVILSRLTKYEGKAMSRAIRGYLDSSRYVS